MPQPRNCACRAVSSSSDTNIVACGKCTACCRGELLILHPDMGDDPGIYETQAVAHPFTGQPVLALKKNFMGDCIYLSRATGCTNYRNRPVMCRKFSCVGLLRATGEAALRQYAHIGVIDNDVIEAAKARISPSLTGGDVMIWAVSHRADPQSVAIADRHYNRQKIGSPQFVPPGRCVVLRGRDNNALWVTSWPFAEYVRHAWAGAWVNSLFRNEGAGLSSELILQAIAVTRSMWTPPEMGIITFVDADKTRHKRDPGRCYRKAGFSHVGFTKGGLWAFQLLPDQMPPAAPPYTNQPSLFEPEAA